MMIEDQIEEICPGSACAFFKPTKTSRKKKKKFKKRYTVQSACKFIIFGQTNIEDPNPYVLVTLSVC